MKVRYIKGDQKGEVGYLGFHEMQAALQAGTIEVVNEAEEQAEVGPEEDKAEVSGSGPTLTPGAVPQSEKPAKAKR